MVLKACAIVAAVLLQSSSFQVFTFMGDTTETRTLRTSLDGNACAIRDTIKVCKTYRDFQVEGADVKWLSLSYRNDKLYEVLGGFYPDRYDHFLKVFTEKYGRPRLRAENWQGESGETSVREIADWNLKGGRLVLSSIGANRNAGSIFFSSYANMPM